VGKKRSIKYCRQSGIIYQARGLRRWHLKKSGRIIFLDRGKNMLSSETEIKGKKTGVNVDKCVGRKLV
jgi:hypothetical protein